MTEFDWSKFSGDDKFIKLEIGDGVEGVITELGEHSFDGKPPVPQLTIDVGEGVERILTVGQVDLRRLLAAHRPEVGDRIFINCTGSQNLSGGKSKKLFAVDVASPGDRPSGHHRPDSNDAINDVEPTNDEPTDDVDSAPPNADEQF